MAQPAEVDEPAQLAAAFYMAIGRFARRLRLTPAPGELSAAEASTLSRLDRTGPATAAELARAELITPQALGTTTAALEKLEYVARRRDPDDGRRILLSVTDAGRQVLRRRRDVRSQRLAEILDERFTPAERETLAAATPLIERLGEWI